MPGLLTVFLTDRARTVRAPRGVLALLGAVCVVAGAVLALRPFTALGVLVALVAICAVMTGVGDLMSAGDWPAPRLHQAAGVIWILIGVVVAASPGFTVTAIAVWVGIALVLTGALRVLAAVTGAADYRVTSLISGVATTAFGVLALAWPDVTVLVVAVVFGARTVLFGLTMLVNAWRMPHAAVAPRSSSARPRGRIQRFTRTTGAVLAVVVAAALGSVSAKLHEGKPVVTAFYTAPRTVPDKPGQLLRSEPFTTAVPEGARAWRILYTTEDSSGRPAISSGIVLVSTSAPAGPRPVIAWAHGTTGFARQCAPSLLKDPFGAGALPALDQIVSRGWVLVATDYIGLGTPGPHPYLIGSGEAHSVLDSVRAARQLSGVQLSDKTVVWGHSQGGGAALWTGQLQPTYAPDVPLAGVAALAPASDLTGLASNLEKVPGGSIFASYIVAAYTAIYPNVRISDYIKAGAQPVVRANASRCLAEPEVFVSIASSLAASDILRRSPDAGPFKTRLDENTPVARIDAPVLLAQGETDQLVLPPVQAAYAHLRCTLGGGPLDYKTYPGRDHVGVVAADSPLIPDLLSWTTDRLAGKPAPTTC